MAGIWKRLVDGTRYSLMGLRAAFRHKDMGSAAVFCAIVLAAAVWLLILATP